MRVGKQAFAVLTIVVVTPSQIMAYFVLEKIARQRFRRGNNAKSSIRISVSISQQESDTGETVCPITPEKADQISPYFGPPGSYFGRG